MLSILIINWNTRDLVIKCVKSIFDRAGSLDFEIIVVDNHSQDGSIEALKKSFGANPKIQILQADENLGFAKANNLAYKNSSGEFIMLLNPDTEITDDALQRLAKYLETHPEAGVVGPKLLNFDGTIQKSVRRFPGIWPSLVIFLGLHRIFPPSKYLMSDFDYKREVEVDQVMGAALITRRAIIEKTGFLDEGFWLWYEEVDFCKRVKLAGYKVMFYPEAQVKHHTGKSFVQMSAFGRKKTMARSLAHYFRKHGSRFDVFLIKLATPVILGLIWVIGVIEGILGKKHRIKI